MIGSILMIIGMIIVSGGVAYAIKKRDKAPARPWVMLGVAIGVAGGLGNILSGH